MTASTTPSQGSTDQTKDTEVSRIAGQTPTWDGTGRSSQSYRDVEELLAERGVQVDHVIVHRWVHRFTSILAETARCTRHAIGSRWQVDETYVKSPAGDGMFTGP